MFSLGEDCEARTQLQRFGLKVDPFAHWWRGGLLLLTLVCATAAAVWAHLATEAGPAAKLSDYIAYVGPVLAFSGLLASYVEWRSSKHEASMDRFYERLELANRYRSKLTDQDQKVSALDMYVFVELDNLEYVLERYRLGYIAPRHALRAARTFQSRLNMPWFKSAATRWACPPGKEGAVGYSADTCALAKRLGSSRGFNGRASPPDNPRPVGSPP
jgi:hypothetical protein